MSQNVQVLDASCQTTLENALRQGGLNPKGLEIHLDASVRFITPLGVPNRDGIRLHLLPHFLIRFYDYFAADVLGTRRAHSGTLPAFVRPTFLAD